MRTCYYSPGISEKEETKIPRKKQNKRFCFQQAIHELQTHFIKSRTKLEKGLIKVEKLQGRNTVVSKIRQKNAVWSRIDKTHERVKDQNGTNRRRVTVW